MVPLALEYYLGVIDFEDEDDSDDDSEGKKDGSDDDDEDGAKKKKKKSKKGGPQLPPGADPKECKQQWNSDKEADANKVVYDMM